MASALPVMALGSPRPPRTLHRVVPYLFGYDDLPLVCVRRARCSSLSARSSASSPCYRAEGLLPLPHLTFALQSPAVRDVEVVSRRLVRVSKDRPFTVLGAEEPTPARHETVPASGIGRQPIPCSAFVVFHHLDGLLLLDPLRILHRSSSLGVRDVSSSTPLPSPSRDPALRSLAPCTQRADQRMADHPGAWPTSPEGHPPVHRRPCLLVLGCPDLEALLRVQSLVPRGVATVARSLLPWACPDSCRMHRGASTPALSRRSRPRQLALVQHIRSG